MPCYGRAGRVGAGIETLAGIIVRFIVDLEKGKPSCQVGKALLVLQILGLAVEATPIGGGNAEGETS